MDVMETEHLAIYRLLDRPDIASASVTAMSGFGNTVIVLELSFRQQDPRVVTIESRARLPIGHNYERAAWPIIERCANAKAAISPPLNEPR